MDNEVISHAESDEKILTFDVPDEALERAASAEQNAFTMLYCTRVQLRFAADCSVLAQQLRQLRKIHRNPPRLARTCQYCEWRSRCL